MCKFSRGLFCLRNVLWAISLFVILRNEAWAANPEIKGELKKWHDVILTFEGPNASETGDVNPFTDYRLNVTFKKGTQSVVVPGYFAADGDAANSGATAGNKWRVHFRPEETGSWSYLVSFRKGPLIAISTNPNEGTSAGSLDQLSGTLIIGETDKSGVDLRGKGRLKYVGQPYLQYSETGEYYLKSGADSPESTLANPDIDPVGTGPGHRSSFSAHGKDWNVGDPVWGAGKLANRGKNLIGAINYLSSRGVNSMYLMTYTGHGDTRSVWPYVSIDARKQFDCSKLDQWEIALSHMEKKGITAQIVLTETENENYWEAMTWLEQHKNATHPKTFGPDLDPYRKLYYRELVARFGHHLGVIWNLGEEIGGTTSSDKELYGLRTTAEQRTAFAQYIRQVDPYQSPIVAHTLPGAYDAIYGPFLNKPYFEGTSLQITLGQYGMAQANSLTRTWLNKAKTAGKPWAIFIDEVGGDSKPLQYSDPANKTGRKDTAGVRPDSLDNDHEDPRKWSLWGNLMAGGSGVEWYFGWEFTGRGGGDGVVTDYSKWNNMWIQTKYAVQFFRENLPYEEMEGDNSLVSPNSGNLKSNNFAYALAKKGSVYCAYFAPGYFESNVPKIDFENNKGTYRVRWFDPRNGGELKTGTLDTVSANKLTLIGKPPSDLDKDWVVLVELQKDNNSNNPPQVSISLNAGTSSKLKAPVDIGLVAQASDDHQVSHVDFYNGSTKLIGDSAAPYTYTWKGVKAGKYKITAIAYDDQGLSTTSNSLDINVADSNQPPSVSLTAPSNHSTFTSPASITITANALDDGSISRVDFYRGTTLLNSDTAAPYTYLWKNVDAGTYSLTAVAYDNDGVSTRSSAIEISVNKANQAPTITLTSPANAASFNEPATIHLAATATDDGKINRVEFYHGNTRLTTETTSPYSFDWKNVPAGTYTLKAVAYDDKGSSTTSNEVKVSVDPEIANDPSVGERDQISLNGTWPTGGVVPNYIGANTKSVTYERDVTVPASWTGKRITVDFDSVNFIADVFVNGNKVLNHVGAWNPFSVDLTSIVSPGSTFKLKVVAYSMKHMPILDAEGKAVWPVGVSTLGDGHTGITDNVWLRAYGKVYISDAFIQTSASNHQLTVDYTLVNSTTSSKTVSIKANVLPSGSPNIEKTFNGPSVTLAGGETKVVRLQSNWNEPTLWWPDHPSLYQLNSQLLIGSSVIDHEYRRFGFREIGIKGNQFQLNGVRINLWGDYAAFGNSVYFPSTSWTPSGWAATLEKLKSLNIREIRLHEHPAPGFALDIADEKGMLIVCESAVEHLTAVNKVEYMKNAPLWLENWVKGSRNHPSIFIWSAENGMGSGGNGVFKDSELLTLGNVIHDADPTRPVSYDGDRSVPDKLVTWHSNIGEPSGSIYGWAGKVSSSKPTGASELISGLPYFKGDLEKHKWWQGIWFRGMRYVGFTDVRPSVYSWASKEMTSQRASNLRNAYAPVALFDKDYDNLGIAPFTEGALPTLEEGAKAKRTLVLYNDEFADTSVTVTVQIKSGLTVYASGTKTVTATLGEHQDIPYSFQVPFLGGKTFELILTTQKGGVQKFTESRTFKVSESGKSGTSSSVITLGSDVTANQPPNVTLNPPVGPVVGGSFVAPATMTLTANASDDHAVARVEFYNGSTLLGSDTSSPYTFSWSNVGAGTYFLSAVAYDDQGLHTSSSVVTLTVAAPNQAPTVTLTSPTGSSSFVAPATITLAANASDDHAISKVEFYNGSTLLGSDTAAPFNFTWSNVPAGTYSLKAVAYDDQGLHTNSSVVSVSVEAPNHPPTVTLTSPKSIDSFVAPATVAITASASDDHAVSKVEFYNGTTLLSSDSSAPYSFSWTNVAAGTYTVKAVAYDDKGISTQSNVVIITVKANQAPHVALTSPVGLSTYEAPATILLNANAADTDGTIKNVSFYNGDKLLFTLTEPPYSRSISNLPVGNYAFKAVATDDKGVSSNSSVVNVSVLAANKAPAITLTSPKTADSFVAPATIALSANASDDHGVTKVEFYNGSKLLGSDATAPYSFTWANVSAGTYSLKAIAYDNQNLQGTSSVVTVTVATPNQPPTITLTSPKATDSFVAPATMILAANASDDHAVSRVEFYNGSTLLSSDNSAPYNFTFSNVAAGTYTLKAIAYDDKGLSASASLNITVAVPNQAPTVQITSPAGLESFTAPETINIAATASDDKGVSKVEFYNGSSLIGTATAAPYLLQWSNVDSGDYILTAVAYDAEGLNTRSSSVKIKVSKPVIPSIANYSLINADNNDVIASLSNGDVVNLATLPTRHLNIRANTDPAKIGSMELNLSGAMTRIQYEHIAPYALFGDLGGALVTGAYTLTSTPYSKDQKGGIAGVPVTLNFTVIDQVLPEVTNFTLINAVKDKSIEVIQDGSLIELSSLPTESLNIRADVTSVPVDYVVFELSGAESRSHTEQYPPFALFNDIGGNYWNWHPVVGSYVLKATPYTTVNGIHVAGPTRTIHFQFK